MKSNSIKIALTAGGTGGHIFPALAIKDNLLKLGHEVIFITDQRYKNYSLPIDDHTTILKLYPISRNFFKLIKGVFSNFIGLLKALKTLKKFNPDIVMGFGGYPTMPVILAAKLLKIKIILHEQNSVLGRINRLFINYANIVATSFHDTQKIETKFLRKAFFTGTPVRKEISALYNLSYPEITENSKINIIVIGGSQGASIFAKIIPDAIKLLPKEIQLRIRLDQQCRNLEEENILKQEYAEMGISADVAPFFKDIAHRLAGAHIVIARAGSSTINEVLISGKPVILVPLPTSMDDHQLYNAEYVVNNDAGWLIKQPQFSPEALAEILEQVIVNPQILYQKAGNAKRISMPGALTSIINMLLVETKYQG
ncbi:MAG: undecaprenyldiphospho-muramoylpentapeptide beta-N-acetylglucosaminyltransferase [Sphingobacteriia bacterium]|nr:undecaprenyldiphospho-muramoylpentapeptide beta-N-acetylglucosaminyltransferase [Sphingobacteriia bacterium]